MPPRRVLIAKPGLDGHDVGARVVSLALRDAGFEVIYTGLRRTPAQIARAAHDEGVDVLGLSVLSGAHLPLCRAVKDELKDLGLANLPWVVGGNIPEHDREELRTLGAAGVLATGTPLDEIVEVFRSVASAVPEHEGENS